MTLQQLQYVVALDTYRHFTKASEKCHVAQPTLTLQVKKLEEEISTVLFDRSKKPIRTTPMGDIFIAKARNIINEVEELKIMVNEDKDSMEGVFRIGIIPTLSSSLLPLFIKSFIKEYRACHDEIITNDNFQNVEDLDSFFILLLQNSRVY